MINYKVLPKKIEEADRNQRIAFELGWDLAKAGFLIPAYAAGSESLVQGWEAASREGKKTVYKKDRYTAKLFHLRFGAWERNRHFSNLVTRDYLAEIDVSICPVTKEALTHGEFADTDASYDRINNDAAYARGNLAVMSVRANFAKGQFNYHKILKFAYDLTVEIPTTIDNYHGMKGDFVPLTRLEWARMASLCSNAPSKQSDDGKMEVTNWYSPCVIYPAPGSLISVPNHLQIAIAFKANVKKICKKGYKKNEFLTKQEQYSDSLKSGLSEQHKTDFNKLVSRAMKVSYDNTYPISMWHNKALYGHFVEFYKTLSEQEKANINVLIETSKVVTYEDSTVGIDDLKLDTFGYTKKVTKRRIPKPPMSN